MDEMGPSIRTNAAAVGALSGFAAADAVGAAISRNSSSEHDDEIGSPPVDQRTVP